MNHPPLPKGPPPQRPPWQGLPADESPLSRSMTRAEWREWQARLAANNAAYQAEHPEWMPPPPTVPEPPPTLWERLCDRIGVLAALTKTGAA